MKINKLYVLCRYLRQKAAAIFIVIICVVIFAAAFLMYGIGLNAVWYPALLCAAICLTLFSADFFRFYRKHSRLSRIKEDIGVISGFKAERGLIDEDYGEVITALEKIRADERTEFNTKSQEALDYYAAWVHQIKAPIAVMRLMLQSGGDENRELLSELFRIEQYADMALCYVRLGDDASDLVIHECALDGIIRAAIRKYAPQLIRGRISVEYNGTTETAVSDEKWLSFIIEQLLSNAVKYAEGGRVTITAENKLITVSDTGIGVAAEDLPRIFEKGFTGYNGRAGKKSTGLGLYLCKTTADKLNHRLTVSSEVGKGSRFHLDLTSYDLKAE